MRVRPGTGVGVAIEESGCLVLAWTDAAVCYQGTCADTARWIALRQTDGDCAAAADRLARAWGTDAACARAELDVWVGEMCRWGLLRREW
jgi:hypothetical protein